MSEISLNINGREARGYDGQTILEVARNAGVEIPTLCHDDRVQMYGSCGVCVVECEGMPRLLRSCSTMATNGMVILTETERIKKSRKTALELLLSDHTGDCRPPCALACPAQTDCQGYVGLIANGEYREALKLVKDKIPLPGSIGRVCPHPCEEACRRKMVEEPISILNLKRFVADLDMENEKGELYTPETAPDTDKSVAIVGGGPGGLTAAYFLREKGHAVTVFDAMPEMGGMLRYGVPEYRLPKAYLASEIEAIRGMGVEFRNNVKLGRDINLGDLRRDYGAVVMAVGAWTSSGLRCPGEELDGVTGGIEFLREAQLGGVDFTGKNIAVVGGSNTAMDCARTAVRLGAANVYVIYRRTRAEMPAEDIEIEEAIEEGVTFKFLVNPIDVQGENGIVKAMRLQIMELGEPDASGRRAPVPVPGKEEIIALDVVISAIGQKLNPCGLEDIALTKWGTISADEKTFRTSVEGVFAIGDATNKGADIAISAIGEAKKAAMVIDAYLNGEEAAYTEPFLVKSNPEESDFASYEKKPREKAACRAPADRKSNFLEVGYAFTEEQAKKEASRCLECGCMDYFECKLLDYSNRYGVQPERLEGEVHKRKNVDDGHPFIHRNPDKCILCGLCARICDEVVGAAALGLVDRGFDAIVKPALDMPLRDTDCISCGQCVSACPTGALTESIASAKQVPIRELHTDTVCSFCSVGCKTRLTHTGDLLLRSLPVNENGRDALLCAKGRFGFGEIAKLDRISKPLIKNTDGGFIEISIGEAYKFAAEKLNSIASEYGSESIAVSVSDRYTNEEAALILNFAGKFGAENVYCLNMGDGGLAETLGADASTAGLDALEKTGLVMLVQLDIMKPHGVAGMRVRRAAANGAKIIALNGFESAADDIADIKLDPGSDLSFLKQILKAVTGLSDAGKKLPGYDGLIAWLEDVNVSEAAAAVAAEYVKAKKAVIMFSQNSLTKDAAVLLADIALCAGKANADRLSPRNGVIQLKPGANTQGLADMGVKPGAELKNKLENGAIKGLVIFGEDVPELDLSGLDFLAVQDLSVTETAKKAALVLPAGSFAESDGSFTNSTGEKRTVKAARKLEGISNSDIIKGLSAAVGAISSSKTPKSVNKGETRLVIPSGDNLSRKLQSTNQLYNAFMRFAVEQGL